MNDPRFGRWSRTRRKEIVTIVLLVAFSALSFFEDRGRGFFIFLETLIYPFQKAVSYLDSGIGRLGGEVGELIKVYQENEELRKRVETLERENIALKEAMIENQRLKLLLNAREYTGGKKHLLCKVVARSPTAWFRTIVVDKGERDGVRPNTPIVDGKGVVGKVISSQPFVSSVMLLLDPDMRIGGIVQRTRAMGVVYGCSTGVCKMRYLTGEKDAAVGDLVLTSGIGGIFPKGIPIGKVIRVRKKGAFFEADILPSSDLSKLEEVVAIVGGGGG